MDNVTARVKEKGVIVFVVEQGTPQLAQHSEAMVLAVGCVKEQIGCSYLCVCVVNHNTWTLL
jgi:hypothetical protein